MEDLKVINNLDKSRFEVDLGYDFAYIDYRYHDDDIVLMHTFVPNSHRGQGIAGKMIKKVLEYIKAEKIPLIVYCPTINKYIENHPEYKELLDEDYGR